MGPVGLSVLVVAIVVVFAGALVAGLYFGTDTFDRGLSQSDAENRVEAAVLDFETSLGSGTGAPADDAGDDIRSMEVDGKFTDADLGSLKYTVSFEWGSNDVQKASYSFRIGQVSFDQVMYCGPDGSVMQSGDEVYEDRAELEDCNVFEEGTEEEEADDAGDEEEGPAECFDALEGLSEEQMDVTPHDNKTVTATFSIGTASGVLELDKKGRLVSIELTDMECSLTLMVDYSDREPITMPEPTAKLTLEVQTFTSEVEGAFHYSVFDATEGALRSDVQVRILDGQGVQVAAFPLSENIRTTAGFTYRWMGGAETTIDVGDVFTLAHEDWTVESQYQVVLWDTWADAEVGSVTVPTIGTPWFLLALGAVLFVARRRHA